MENNKASRYFFGKEKYNCAQAIAKYFQEEYNITDELIASYKSKGSGRIEGGICGSCYAAEKLLKNPEDVEKFKQYFIEKAGSLKCKEIRDLKVISCAGTVDLAADLLKEFNKGDRS